MIYYVDEEFNRNKSKIRKLKSDGFTVVHCGNATEAWEVLYSANIRDIELIIVDVMLAAGARYDRQQTHEYLTTGLQLLRDLLQQRKELATVKILLFSAASRPDIVEYIKVLAAERKLLYKSKSDFDSVHEFSAYVRSIVGAPVTETLKP